MNLSVSDSNSHCDAWIASGPVATLDRGPMGAVTISLDQVSAEPGDMMEPRHSPARNGKEIGRDRYGLLESIKRSFGILIGLGMNRCVLSRKSTGDDG